MTCSTKKKNVHEKINSVRENVNFAVKCEREGFLVYDYFPCHGKPFGYVCEV